MIGGMAGGLIDPETLQGAQFSGRSIAGSESGLARAIIFGTTVVEGRLMDGEDTPRKGTRTESAGKGGPEIEHDTALLSYAIEICESSELRDTLVGGVLAVWEDEKLVYDVREGSLVSAPDNAKWLQNKTFYFGEEGQSPSALLESIHGAGNVPAYVGTCRMDVEDEDMVLHGERLPRYRFLVSRCPVEPPNFLLVTGQSKTDGGPVWCASLVGDEVAFTGLDPDTGADIPNGIPAYTGGIWCVAGTDTARRSYDNRVSWQTIPLDSAGWPMYSLVGGAEGWFGRSDLSYNELVQAERLPAEFTNYTATAPWTNDGGLWNVEEARQLFKAGIYYFAAYDRNLYRSLSPDGPWETLHDQFSIVAAGGNPNGDCIVAWRDAVKIGSNTYFAVSFGFDEGTRRSQIRWSPDDGVTMPDANIVYEGEVALSDPSPMQLVDCGGTLVAYCPGDGVITSADGYSTLHATGLDGPNTLAAFAGRKIASLAGDPRAFVIGYGPDDGDKCIVFDSSTLVMGSPITMPIRSATGIAASSAEDVIGGGVLVPDAPGYEVDPITGEIIGPASSVGNACGMYLDDVVRSLYSLGSEQITDAMLDLSALSAYYVRGYSVADVGASSADGIEPLRRTYFFDLPEYDGKINARLRGGAINWTIDTDDIIPGEESTLEGKRGQEVSYPRTLQLTYAALSTDYKPTTQIAEDINPDTFTNSDESYQTNLVLNDDEAAKVADVMLKVMRTEREDEQKFSLPIQYVGIIPSDLLSIDGRRYRVDQMRTERNRIVIERAVYDRASAYYSEAVGVEGIRRPPPLSSVRGPVASAVMNSPVLRDEDDRAGVYWAASGYLSGYVGAILQLSRDGGLTYEDGPQITTASTMGLLTADLPSASAFGQDNTNTLRVRLNPGARDLDSATYEGLIAEDNVAAIMYADGTVEIIQFQTAVETADREYDLTGLMRGRQDTVAGEHLSGAQFVLLDENVRFVAIRPDDLGKTLTFRAVSIGTNADDNVTQTITMTTIESLREWQPYNVTMEADGLGGFCVDWIGRARLGSSLMPAHSQWFEGYRVTFTFEADTYEVDTTDQSACVDAATMLDEFGVGYGVPQVTVRARSRIATNDDDFDSPPATPTNPDAGQIFSATGTFPEWYRGVYCVLWNGDADLEITGGYWDAGATGDVMPGVGVYAKVPLGDWFQATGIPTTAGAATTDVTVYADSPVPGYGGNATITHANTCLPAPIYSPIDLRFRSRFHNRLVNTADPGSTFDLVNGNTSFYSHGFSAGKCRAEFTIVGSTYAFWFGFYVGKGDLTNADNTVRVGYLMTDGAAAATTGDGTYWAEYEPATGAYEFGKVGGATIASGTFALPAGKLARFAISTDYLQNVRVTCNFGIQTWLGTPSSGYGGVPYPITTIPVQWDVPAPSNAIMRLGDGLRGVYYGLRWSVTGYVMKGTEGKSSGQWQFAAAGGRVGISVASFIRTAGQLGDAGTADSVGWDGTTLRACLGGVQTVVSLPFYGAAIFALDADADELRICRTNEDGTAAIVHVLSLPSGLTWFPAVTDGGSPLLTYDPAGLPGYSNWTTPI